VVHELVLIFDEYDLDGSGSLDAEEVRKMVGVIGEDLSEAEAKALVAHLDRDGDGDVSLAEFVIWAFKRQQDNTPMKVEELAGLIFDQVFDDTKDGKIDVNEFIVGLEKVKSELTYDEKHDLFREADENGGGTIDKEEFVTLIMKYSD
jgi:calmodulin